VDLWGYGCNSFVLAEARLFGTPHWRDSGDNLWELSNQAFMSFSFSSL